jgi:hypothetical protein
MTSAFSRAGKLVAMSFVLLTAIAILASRDESGYAQTTKKKPAPPKPAPNTTKFEPLVKIPTGPPGAVPAATDEPVKAINELLEKAWKENTVKVKTNDGKGETEESIRPSAVCSDFDFIRRVSLDIIGRIATPEEIARFLSDPAATRRAQLIDRLLGKTMVAKDGKTAEPDKYRQEYARNWANIWTTWLMTRTGNSINHEQLQYALQDEFEKDNLSYKELVFKLLTASGKTQENGLVNYIATHVGESVPANKQAEEGQFEMVPITSRTTRLFLGYQTQCTQCHDHPFNPEWKQNHFWGVNAFFRQVSREGAPLAPNQRKMNDANKFTVSDNPGFNKDGIIYYEKRNGVILPTKSVFLDGQKFPADSKLSRREVLANMVTNQDQFAKAFVNRMWGHFFGRGLNENPTVDDFGEHNKVVHPELLDRLAKSFSGSGGYDPKNLIRWICSSKAYNLSASANATNRSSDAEPFFARMMLKAMSPEQLFESLMVATSRNDTKDVLKQKRQRWMNLLTTNFGDDEGNEVTFNGTVVQALLLMNGQDINDAVTSPAGTPVKALRRGTPKGIMDDLYLAALNRTATPKEAAIILNKLRMNSPDREAVHPWQDLFWALLNSDEFILNH